MMIRAVFISIVFSVFLFLVKGDSFQLPTGVDGEGALKLSGFSKGSDEKGYLQFSNEDSFLDGQLNLVIEDTLDEGDDALFTPRTTIHVRSIKSGNAVITHTRKWTEEDTRKLKTLTENDGFYRIRVKQGSGDENGIVSTLTKGCQVYESGLSEILSMMVDHTGHSIIGVSLFTPISVCTGDDHFPFQAQYNTSVIIRSPTIAPIPDTATYIRKMEAIKTEKTEGKDNRSFLSKYWMYIVPFVLFILISGSGQEGTR